MRYLLRVVECLASEAPEQVRAGLRRLVVAATHFGTAYGALVGVESVSDLNLPVWVPALIGALTQGLGKAKRHVVAERIIPSSFPDEGSGGAV